MANAVTEPARVFVSGLGPVTCLGLGADELAASLAALSMMGALRKGPPAGPSPTGLVPEFDLADFIETRRPYLDPQTKCALAAGALALDSAAVEHDEVDPDRCGLAFATEFGCLQTQALFQEMVNQKGMRLGSPVLFSHSYPNSAASVLAIEFALRGYNQNFCGDALCGAQALECAFQALRRGRADLMLAGGGDVVGADLLGRLRGALPGGTLRPAEGMAFLTVETQDALERREGYAFCELSAMVCAGVPGDRSPADVGRALAAAAETALQEAAIWEGDVGLVAICTAESVAPEAAKAEREALGRFSQVPFRSIKPSVGETFAAGFPLECIAAAEVLNSGHVPPDVFFYSESRGVEFWVEGEREPLMGDAALVVGCSPSLVAAAVLRAF